MKDSIELRQEVINCCLWLVEKSLTIGTWGNISVRLDDGNILITPSRIRYEVMQPEDLVVLSPEGTVIKGFRLATSERELHRLIMNRRKDINAIIHAHSPYAMAACTIEGGIPAITEEMCQLLGGEIPLSKRFVPSEKHLELGEIVADSIGDKNAVLIRNHGPVACGSSLDEAKVCCQVVEKSAQIYLAVTGNHSPNIIQDQWVKAGRRYYTDSYGKS